jgi:oxepin-CoA hydrolase/3-oxo-5,6-dehydrosuberyl-CoA semialdehyde dehydrogenase
MRSMVKALSHFEKNPKFSSTHPYFGELNVEEWLALHKKHLRHHLTQFGLVRGEVE